MAPATTSSSTRRSPIRSRSNGTPRAWPTAPLSTWPSPSSRTATVRFDYGAGNTNQSPTIGISFGNGQVDLLSGYDGKQNLSNVAPVAFAVNTPGIVDIGAIEFPASSLQTAPPVVTSTFPAQVDAGSNTGDPISQLQLSFGENVNPKDADSPAVYELRKAGTNGFGSTDDVIYSLSPQYAPPPNESANTFTNQSSAAGTVTLGINGLSAAGLPVGEIQADDL